MKLTTPRRIDSRLVMGSVLFGVRWGVAGFCPGPGLVALGMGEAKAFVFVAAMLAGMGIFELLERRKQMAGLRPAWRRLTASTAENRFVRRRTDARPQHAHPPGKRHQT